MSWWRIAQAPRSIFLTVTTTRKTRVNEQGASCNTKRHFEPTVKVPDGRKHKHEGAE